METKIIISTKEDNRIVQPYLFFDGRCEEALAFYRKALGAEVTALVRFKDNPNSGMCAPGAFKRHLKDGNEPDMSASKQIDKQIAGIPGWRGRTMAYLRNVISAADSKLTEEFKWNTAVWSANGNVCALGAFKDHIKINFSKGRYCRTLTICSIADLRQKRRGQSISTRATL